MNSNSSPFDNQLDDSSMQDSNDSGKINMLPSRSVEEAATDGLRNAILQGRLKPGEKLSQGDLAEQLGVSRIPLRDAFRRLEAEQLITIDGRRGARVSALSPDDIKEIYEMRIMLEERCAIYAAKNMDDAAIAKLLNLLDEMDDKESSSEDNGYSARRAFYSELYSYAKRPRMSAMILLLRDNVGRYHRFTNRQHAHEAHTELREGIVQRDGKRMARALKKHLADARDDLVSSMGI